MASWRENKVIGVVAVIVAVIAIIGVVVGLQPRKTKMTLMSKNTGVVMEVAVAPGAKFPIKNPKTGQDDLYPAVQVKCQKCGWMGYIISYFEPGKPAETKCPKCGADRRFLQKP